MAWHGAAPNGGGKGREGRIRQDTLGTLGTQRLRDSAVLVHKHMVGDHGVNGIKYMNDPMEVGMETCGSEANPKQFGEIHQIHRPNSDRELLGPQK